MVKHMIYAIKIGPLAIPIDPPIEWTGEEGTSPDYFQLVKDAGHKFDIETKPIETVRFKITGFVEV